MSSQALTPITITGDISESGIPRTGEIIIKGSRDILTGDQYSWDFIINGNISITARAPKTATSSTAQSSPATANCIIHRDSNIFPLAVKIITSLKKGSLLEIKMTGDTCTSIAVQHMSYDR